MGNRYPPVRIVAPTFLIHRQKKNIFGAVAESRRWRIQTARKSRGLSFEEQQALLRRTTEAFLAGKPARRSTKLARR